MPIDARIPLSVFANQPDAVGAYSNAFQLRQLAKRQKLEDLQAQHMQMQMDEARKKQAEDDAMKAAAANAVTPAQTQQVNIPGVSLGQYGDVGGHTDSLTTGPQFDQQRMLSNLAANPQTAYQVPAYQHQFSQQAAQEQMAKVQMAEALAKANSEQLKQIQQHLQVTGQYFNAVQSAPDEQKPMVYQQVRAHAIQSGVMGANDAPPQYDPNWVGQQIAQAQTVEQAVQSEAQRRAQAETARHNSVSEANQVAGQAVTMRGQNMTDNRSREQNQIARETKLEMNKAADENSLVSFNASMDRLAAAAKELKDHPGLGGITGKMGVLPNMPGGEAANAKAKLGTLKSQVAFTTLQEMRNNSKTGGALGQVSDKEGQLLESNIASLETAQSKEEYQKSLQKIIDQAEGAKARGRAAIDNKYKSVVSAPLPGSKQQQSQPQATHRFNPATGQIEPINAQ